MLNLQMENPVKKCAKIQSMSGSTSTIKHLYIMHMEQTKNLRSSHYSHQEGITLALQNLRV